MYLYIPLISHMDKKRASIIGELHTHTFRGHGHDRLPSHRHRRTETINRFVVTFAYLFIFMRTLNAYEHIFSAYTYRQTESAQTKRAGLLACANVSQCGEHYRWDCLSLFMAAHLRNGGPKKGKCGKNAGYS